MDTKPSLHDARWQAIADAKNAHVAQFDKLVETEIAWIACRDSVERLPDKAECACGKHAAMYGYELNRWYELEQAIAAAEHVFKFGEG